jgi:hypothetical protein
VAVSLCSICGAVIFAYYAGCDPKSRKAITSSDQVNISFIPTND